MKSLAPNNHVNRTVFAAAFCAFCFATFLRKMPSQKTASYISVMFKEIILNRKTVSTLALILFICSSSCWANSEHYEYDFTNEEKAEKITLRFSNVSVNKFPGWKHDRTRTASISMWYPSLTDAASPNVWMS